MLPFKLIIEMLKNNKENKMKTKKTIPKVCNDEVLIVKVGTDMRPAGTLDIEAIQMLLAQAKRDDATCIVTHHAVSFEKIKRSSLNNLLVVKCN